MDPSPWFAALNKYKKDSSMAKIPLYEYCQCANIVSLNEMAKEGWLCHSPIPALDGIRFLVFREIEPETQATATVIRERARSNLDPDAQQSTEDYPRVKRGALSRAKKASKRKNVS
jgi:hypothetical protein